MATTVLKGTGRMGDRIVGRLNKVPWGKKWRSDPMVIQKHKCMCRRELPAVVTLCHGQMDRVWPGTLRFQIPYKWGEAASRWKN